ncbi:MAG: hypothetical protein DWB56_10380 [Candidatus Jettenia sp.]|uniref:hypothetical protein n=1 Tax=Candidatus Jettenia sp. AMX1 TaxID=2293637 RepID=UPI00058D5C28|nr:hypothetical protein [Candidatus Jettenia sp. AMX1]MBC6929351.1 hypothetical protein [Candidatus Jettenia sp.]NUN22693.1 hypothetical protein [Candidatus Jettenia caeni]KAA0249636.1 MAG: hypothetical protein EDM77_07780 [Candidatus Jettenia sp. AMX1]MCE7880736.1 hypothetical protein [Candidatus Jettenia sp. AMX1]MCQ3927582.1 hypothetical protein [Candidatus Jettenia sp.]
MDINNTPFRRAFWTFFVLLQLGLNGNSFHHFVATKTNATGTTDVFVFSAPLRMMLHPQATFYFSGVAAVAVSGYLVDSE